MTSLTYVKFVSGVPEVMYSKVCNYSLNITIVMGSQISYISIFSMGHTYRNMRIGLLHVKRRTSKK